MGVLPTVHRILRQEPAADERDAVAAGHQQPLVTRSCQGGHPGDDAHRRKRGRLLHRAQAQRHLRPMVVTHHTFSSHKRFSETFTAYFNLI